VIHTSDLLEKLDRVLSQPYLAPASTCGLCGKVLTGTEPSLDFCNDSCQWAWQYRQADGQMVDEPDRSACLGDCCSPTGSIDTEREPWAAVGLGAVYDAHVRFIRSELDWHPESRVSTSRNNRVLSALARWLGLDPDR
jgi:hypothetical protein